ncbi:hypothetical protein [Marinomonas sp.]|uniref:hypothetical protein n=1 Tax=Marinomonas sp. TaxID=1904862 RepID=UPI003BACF325
MYMHVKKTKENTRKGIVNFGGHKNRMNNEKKGIGSADYSNKILRLTSRKNGSRLKDAKEIVSKNPRESIVQRAEYSEITINNGITRFIKHVNKKGDIFVFEVNHNHIISVSIASVDIGKYYKLLGAAGEQFGKAFGESPLDAKDDQPAPRHKGAHDAGGFGISAKHSHWASLKGHKEGGFEMLAVLAGHLDDGIAMQISQMVTANCNQE